MHGARQWPSRCCRASDHRAITAHDRPPRARCAQHQPRRRTPRPSSSSNWDHPALYSAEDAFWLPSYWDKRYTEDRLTFEWYRDYDSLAPIINRHLPRSGRLLQVGVGSSRIQADMALDGYVSILSVDFSQVAIQRLQQLQPALPQLSFAVADVRRMEGYPEGSFDGILDKGTLDALLCGEDDEAAAADMLREMRRLLVQGASYVMITSAAPSSRLRYIQCAPAGDGAWSQVLVYEVGQQGSWKGPWPLTAPSSKQQLQQLPAMAYSHMVYVCVK